jgi:methionyl aminopeptidase
MQEGGLKLSRILAQLLQMSRPDTNLLEVEKKAMDLIKKTGGKAGFALVPGYHWATCLNVNDEIVHGVPKDYVLQAGDVLNIDVGLFYKGFNTDMSNTVYIKNPRHPEPSHHPESASRRISGSIDKFLATGKKALEEAIKQAKAGNRVAHISQKIQQIVEGAGYHVARNLTGHGLGKKLHQPPAIPGFVSLPLRQTPLLKPGMTLAIEVIYCMGSSDLVLDEKDGWTFRSKDGQMTAVFEKDIAVTEDKPLILTPFFLPSHQARQTGFNLLQ